MNNHHIPKPEIVCWKKDWMWVLAVEVPKELLPCSNLSVVQESLPLYQDNERERCWRLRFLTGPVEVRGTENGAPKHAMVDLGYNDCLMFKLVGEDLNQGSYIGNLVPSPGSTYLVVVPNVWRRDYELSGPPPLGPDYVSIPGYQAHFFFPNEEGEAIAFIAPQGRRISLSTREQIYPVKKKPSGNGGPHP